MEPSALGSSAPVWLLLLTAVVAANLTFVNERLLIVGLRHAPKRLGWRLIELILMCGLLLGAGIALEANAGQIQPQGWELYVVIGFLSVTLALPGFVWRYLRRRP